MRHPGPLVLVITAALATAGAASAAPLSLAWDQCLPEGGIQHKYFACDTNARNEVLVASFVSPVDMPNLLGVPAVIEGRTAGSVPLPDWWQVYNPGSCRQTAVAVSADFLSSPGTACTDPWQGEGTFAGVTACYTYEHQPPFPLPFVMPDAFSLRVVAALSTSNGVPITAGREYYAFKLILSHARSTGAGSCAGCATGLCLTLKQLTLAPESGSQVELVADHGTFQDPYVGTAVATWECAEEHVSYAGHGPLDIYCVPGANCSVPARSRTWGSIKALYR